MAKTTRPVKITTTKGTEAASAKKAAKPAPKAKATSESAPAHKVAAKKEAIVGSLLDWPLGARLVKLLGLPDSVGRLGCFQVIGTHGKDVSKAVFAAPETISAELAPFENAILAVIATCTSGRSASFTSEHGFHANLTPEELAARLSADFLVRSPAEAREARRLTPAQSLGRIEKAAEVAKIGRSRKQLMAYLEGGPLTEGLLGADAHELGKCLVANPDLNNEVDDRLFHLWVRAANETTMPPMPPFKPELGFDRFGAWHEKMVAAGMNDRGARDHLLIKLAQHSRWWPSTGVWVWEQLARDPQAFCERVLTHESSDIRFVDVLTSVLWLPEGALEAGAAEAVRKACSSPDRVPDDTLARLRKDSEIAPLLASVKRESPVARQGTTKVARVVTRVTRKLIELR